MRFLLERRFFNVEGGGGAAAAPPSDAGGGAAVPPAGAAAAAAAPAPSGAAAAAASEGAPPAGDLYRPNGLADNLLGKSNTETIDNMQKALDGYRSRDAANLVPDDATAYSAFADDIPAVIKPHVETLAGDPLFSRVSEKALALKVSVPVYQALVQEFVSASHEMGMMEPIIDANAERAALVPETAKHLPEAEQKAAVDQRMNENFAFMDALGARGADNGGLAKDDVDFAKAMLGDSAKGHRVLEFLRAAAGGGTGGGPALNTPGAGQLDHKAELKRRAGLPENTWGDPKFNQASYDQLDADYKRFHGE
jgi:hypothetical protein